MSMQRQINGDYRYRGLRIRLNPRVAPDKMGRWSVDGKPFAQREHARQFIDNMKAKGDE